MTIKIRFLRDYRGAATQENFFERGQESIFDDAAAQALFNEGVAERVDPEPAPVPAAKPSAPVKKQKGK